MLGAHVDTARLLGLAAAWDAMPTETRRCVFLGAAAIQVRATPAEIAHDLQILERAGALILAWLDAAALDNAARPVPVAFSSLGPEISALSTAFSSPTPGSVA